MDYLLNGEYENLWIYNKCKGTFTLEISDQFENIEGLGFGQNPCSVQEIYKKVPQVI